MVPQPTTATPTGPMRHRAVVSAPLRACGWAGWARPRAASHARLSPTAVIMSVAQRSSSTTCHSADVARGQDLGDRHPPGADRGHRVILGHRAVLHVQVADAVAEPAQQRGHVLAADRRPVGIDLEQHPVVQRAGQHLERGPAVHDRGRARSRGCGSRGAGPRRRSGPRSRSAQRPAPGRSSPSANRAGGRYGTMTVSAPSVLAACSTAAACSPDGVACTLHATRPAASRSARSPAGSLSDVERLHRAVTEAGDLRQDALPVGRHLLADGVQLQGGRVGGSHASSDSSPRRDWPTQSADGCFENYSPTHRLNWPWRWLVNSSESLTIGHVTGQADSSPVSVKFRKGVRRGADVRPQHPGRHRRRGRGVGLRRVQGAQRADGRRRRTPGRGSPRCCGSTATRSRPGSASGSWTC